MSVSQRDAYEDSEEIDSDPFGVLDRDNRNHRKKQRLISERSAAAHGDRVLEVGCGGGLHAREWGDRYDLTAVDLSRSLCQQTRARAPEATVIQADATALPFPDDHFHSVVGAAVLHHLPDAADALAEWSRVARSSVTLSEPNYLFLKDLLTAHTVPEEEHKTQMAPWRLRETLADAPGTWTLDHRLFTPPWPEGWAGRWDRVDAVCRRVPGLRRLSQLLLIHGRC